MTVSTPTEYRIADLALADWGRKEIAIAESEMPALMVIREEYAATQPLKGARIAGTRRTTLTTAGPSETPKILGPRHRRAAARSSAIDGCRFPRCGRHDWLSALRRLGGDGT